jgi:hypothetical protein
MTTMATTRHDLKQQLAKLDAEMREKNGLYPGHDDFMDWFSSGADNIAENAGDADFEWTWSEIDRLLTKHGPPAETDALPPDM